jgi:hypothetical protein
MTYCSHPAQIHGLGLNHMQGKAGASHASLRTHNHNLATSFRAPLRTCQSDSLSLQIPPAYLYFTLAFTIATA